MACLVRVVVFGQLSRAGDLGPRALEELRHRLGQDLAVHGRDQRLSGVGG